MRLVSARFHGKTSAIADERPSARTTPTWSQNAVRNSFAASLGSSHSPCSRDVKLGGVEIGIAPQSHRLLDAIEACLHRELASPRDWIPLRIVVGMKIDPVEPTILEQVGDRRTVPAQCRIPV